MIFRCTNQKCNKLQELTPTTLHCPICNSILSHIEPQTLTGDDFCTLGIYWHDQAGDHNQKILDYFKKSAAKGSGWGTSNLAWCMEDGIGTNADPRQAFWLYKQSATMGHLPALCSLGVCYQKGIGTPKNNEKAFSLYEQSAEIGLVRSQLMMANCYTDGIGVEKNLEKAQEWLCMAALQGDLSAQGELANRYLQGVGCEINIKLALRWHLKAATAGHGESQYQLGKLCEEGIILDKDEKAAVAWYSKATISRHPQGTYALALTYLKESSETANPEQGLKLLFSAGQMGHIPAIYRIGFCYYDGIGTKQDFFKAFNWWMVGAKLDHSACQVKIGECYEKGEGITENPQEALIWHKKSAQSGNPQGLCNLFHHILSNTSDPKKHHLIQQEFGEKINQLLTCTAGEPDISQQVQALLTPLLDKL